MKNGFFEQPLQLLNAVAVAPGDIGRSGGEHQLQGIEGRLDRSGWGRPAPKARRRGGGVLAGGQAVDPVVVQYQGDIDVPLGGKDEMLQPLGQAVSVPGKADHLQIGIGNLDRRGHRYGPSMNGIEAVYIEVVHDLGVAAYSGDQDHIFQR